MDNVATQENNTEIRGKGFYFSCTQYRTYLKNML